MKKVFILFLSVALFSGTAAMAQTKTASANSLKWKTTNIDMGKIPQGTPATVTFDFENVSKSPVALKTVQPGCGCTTSDYTREPIAPKKNGFVKATYNAMNMGSYTKSITVTTDSGEQTVLMIHGEVVPKPATTPPAGGK